MKPEELTELKCSFFLEGVGWGAVTLTLFTVVGDRLAPAFGAALGNFLAAVLMLGLVALRLWAIYTGGDE